MAEGGKERSNSSIDLAGLASPCRLAGPARLYAVVHDAQGLPGQRHFLVDLPEGSAVFSLAAPSVSFLLVDRVSPLAPPAVAGGPIDASAIDAWYAGLLSCAGLPRGDGEAVPMDHAARQRIAASAIVTTRRMTWLRTASPVLRYPGAAGTDGPAATKILPVADQIGAELADDAEVETVETATLLEDHAPEALGRWSGDLATRLAASLMEAEAAERLRRQSAQALDEDRAFSELKRLRDIAAFRSNAAFVAEPGGDPLATALAAIAATEGFALRLPRDDDRGSPLSERLRRFAIATPFAVRPIRLDGDWWKEEGPAFLGTDAVTSEPRAVVWRRGRWRLVDPGKAGDTPVDKAAAGTLQASAYMIYPSLPEPLGKRQFLHFTLFGVAGDMARIVTASAAATFAGLLLPIATGAILGIAIPEGRLTLLGDMLILLGATALGAGAFEVVRTLALIRLSTHINRRIGPAMWDRVLRLRPSFFRDYSTGDLADRILGVNTIRNILSGLTVNAALGGVFSLASLGLMLIYDATLAAFAAAYTVVAVGLIFALGRQQMRLDRVVMQRRGMVSGLLIEMLRGIGKLRIAAAELRAFSRWAEAFAEQRANNARSSRLAGAQTVLATSLPILGALGIFGLAGAGAYPIDIGTFAAFNSAFGQFTTALLAVATALNGGIEVVPLLARVRPAFEAPLEVDSSRIDPGPLGGHLAVRNLSFRYSPDAPWSLQDVDFEVRPGEFLAIVGPSGSGKSTILRLLIGFESPERSGIYYDDRELEKLDLRPLRRQIGTVLETSALIPGTLYENIAGSEPLPRKQVEEALRLAGLEADLARMPMGLQTFVGEGSGQLSGGQRQRVMIARAFVRKPRFLFLDEATSALDNRTQAIVSASMAAMNATRIVIAHRLSTIRGADRILVLERGRIVETGTYNELMAGKGAFYRLAQRQLL